MITSEIVHVCASHQEPALVDIVAKIFAVNHDIPSAMNHPDFLEEGRSLCYPFFRKRGMVKRLCYHGANKDMVAADGQTALENTCVELFLQG